MAKIVRRSYSPLKMAIVLAIGFALIAINGIYLIAERIPASQAKRSISMAPWRGDGYSDAAVDLLKDPRAAKGQSSFIRSLAMSALAHSPLDTGGYYALVRVLEAEGKNRLAKGLALATQDISRRDPNVQMYLTSQAAQRNNIDGVMHHLNIVLRTSRSGRAVAFPILCNALTDSRSIKLVARNLRENANWVAPFVEQCSSSAPTVANLAMTLMQAPAIARDSQMRVHVNILANLVDQKRLRLAGQYYGLVTRASTDRRAPGADHFERIGVLPYFDWSVAADGGIYVDQLGGRKGVAVSTDTSLVPLMERMHSLSPGRYRLTSDIKDLELPERADLFWTVQCYGDDGRLATLSLKASKAPQAVSFDVPAQGCQAQEIRLRSLGAGQAREISGEIPFVKIEHVSSKGRAGSEQRG